MAASVLPRPALQGAVGRHAGWISHPIPERLVLVVLLQRCQAAPQVSPAGSCSNASLTNARHQSWQARDLRLRFVPRQMQWSSLARCRWHEFAAPSTEQVKKATQWMGGVLPPPAARAEPAQPAPAPTTPTWLLEQTQAAAAAANAAISLLAGMAPNAGPAFTQQLPAAAAPPSNAMQRSLPVYAPFAVGAPATAPHMAAAAEAAMQMGALRLHDQQQPYLYQQQQQQYQQLAGSSLPQSSFLPPPPPPVGGGLGRGVPLPAYWQPGGLPMQQQQQQQQQGQPLQRSLHAGMDALQGRYGAATG